jgi:nucleoside-diphosphate-sugar epimerase
MNIFITGATGFIGSAVAETLFAAGHSIRALAHTAEVAATLAARGWDIVHGGLADATLLSASASEADAVVHVANTGGPDAGAVDTAATRAILSGVGSTGAKFIYTSGIWVVGEGRTNESSPARPVDLIAWRGELEQEILSTPAVNAVIVRPAIVYGRGGGIPGMLARGELPVIGVGDQHWPLVHIDDLARLYLRALDARAGSILHGVGLRMTMRELALLAHHGTPNELETISLEEARARFGAFADALALDQDPDATATRAMLNWQPSAPTPIEEFLTGSYLMGANV